MKQNKNVEHKKTWTLHNSTKCYSSLMYLKRCCQKTLRITIKNVTLSKTTLSTWCFGVNMQSNVFVQCLLCCVLRFYSYSEYRYTDCFDTKCRYAECYNIKYSYSECHSTECRYSECGNVVCHCAITCLIEPVVS